MNTIENAIGWSTPNFEYELGEYFDNEPTKDYFKKYKTKFENKKQLINVLKRGRLVEWKGKKLDNFSDIKTSEKSYQKSYIKLIQSFKMPCILQAPIVFIFEEKIKYLFSGNRRLNFAIQYKITPFVWEVQIEDKLLGK